MLRLEEETEKDGKRKKAIHRERPKNAPKNGESERQKDQELQVYMDSHRISCRYNMIWSLYREGLFEGDCDFQVTFFFHFVSPCEARRLCRGEVHLLRAPRLGRVAFQVAFRVQAWLGMA